MRRALRGWVAMVSLAGCAHHSGALTASEHREQAALNQQRAATEQKAYDPNATAAAVVAPTPGAAMVMRLYNPTEAHLREADRQMSQAFEHLKAAQRLEGFENQMCSGLSVAVRRACPVLAPHVTSVEEVTNGVSLHLKPTASAGELGMLMRCHLAFALANGFDREPCPLYVKGVQIDLLHDQQIDVVSSDPTVAVQVRVEARRLFGEPLALR